MNDVSISKTKEKEIKDKTFNDFVYNLIKTIGDKRGKQLTDEEEKVFLDIFFDSDMNQKYKKLTDKIVKNSMKDVGLKTK